jgi:penicillin amidase
MADSLTANAKRETYMQAWKEKISPEWWQFLFSREHPWNTPIFGKPKRTKVPLPPKSQFLPIAPIEPQKMGSLREPQSPVGSNNWAYRGTKGAFLANDPHLQQSIPSIWYASRLILSETDWIVGVAVPGLPGITIGMNPHVAWAFTNTNEDVDDYIEEAVSDDHIYYRVRGEGGVEVWEPIIRKEYEVPIKGQASKKVQALFTHRGPLRTFTHMQGRWFSRQWLAFQPEVLRLPTLTLGRAKSLKESDTELDQMRLPSQNVLLMDRLGQYGLRISGTGVQRKSHEPYVLNGSDGEWEGLEPATSRRRLFPEKKGHHQFIATANQRIWVDDHEHLWFPDDRVRRINEVLAVDSDLTREDMENLQMDTHSKFRKLLIDWVLKNSTDSAFKEKFSISSRVKSLSTASLLRMPFGWPRRSMIHWQIYWWIELLLAYCPRELCFLIRVSIVCLYCE